MLHPTLPALADTTCSLHLVPTIAAHRRAPSIHEHPPQRLIWQLYSAPLRFLVLHSGSDSTTWLQLVETLCRSHWRLMAIRGRG
ncbi:hypothetical protein CFAM422_002769 [Trichoderma lentiforme]|uniref:Uncharacterized protein n=1 Tax=Trichoderma lentiforme TaxID=1567552 RepID=A0A9P4XMC4_9HYPO|nr:hypothetical protein CFAM422_002769 [Trichoderma lentiforme]